MDLSGTELLIVLLVIVILFGSTRLPKLARSLGEAQREFRRGVAHSADDRSGHSEPAATTAPAPAVPPSAPAPGAPPITPVAPDTVGGPGMATTPSGSAPAPPSNGTGGTTN
jgi:sec-independent protein translocase protein TatA